MGQKGRDNMPTLMTSLTNCTCSIENYTVLTRGEPNDITITADEGYIFETPPTLNNSASVLDITLNDSKNVYNGTVTLNTSYNVRLTAEAVEGSAPEPEKTMHFNVEITDAITNVDNETLYGGGDEVHVTVVANEGYYFATAPSISFINYSGTTTTYTMLTDDVDEFKKNFYYDFTFPDKVQLNVFNIEGNAQVIPEVNKYGIITIYNPTPTELKEIGNVRYMHTTDSSVDLGNYIANLIKVFVKIPKGKTANVVVGGYNTDVVSNVVTTDVIETDCGSVEIVGNYKNAMDYDNTTVEIYLPLIGFKQLDTEKVMNETLSLIYKTNVINGDTIACLYNASGTLLYTFNTTASFEIPYRLNSVIEPKGQLEINSNYFFGFTPFITVRYNKAYNIAIVIANDNIELFIKDITSYIKCSEVFNTVKATATEKAEIERLLKEGIII